MQIIRNVLFVDFPIHENDYPGYLKINNIENLLLLLRRSQEHEKLLQSWLWAGGGLVWITSG